MAHVFNAGAVRDQPVKVVNAQNGETICTVTAGPKTHVWHIKEDIFKDTGYATREQKLFSGDVKDCQKQIQYKDSDVVGAGLFKEAHNEERDPQFILQLLTSDEADKLEGIQEAIEKMEQGKIHLKDLEETYRSESEVVLWAVEHHNPSELQHAGERIKADFATMLQALKISTMSVYYVAESLWEDKQFVKSAVEVDGMILGAKAVPVDWRSDIDIVITACESNGMALKFAAEDLRADRACVIAAVTQRGTALMYASEDLKADRHVVLDAVRNQKMAIVHAKGGLRDDDDIRAAAGQGPSDKMLEKVERIKAKFHKLDTNGDGYLSFDELAVLLRKGNPDLPEDEIRLLYNELDTHSDGKVDFHEFCDYVFRDEEEEE